LAKADPESGGVYNLSEAGVDSALAGIEVREVWGVGPRWAAWLEAQGLTTALDLKRADPKAIRRKMTVVGERLAHELNGRPCLPRRPLKTSRRLCDRWDASSVINVKYGATKAHSSSLTSLG
jgi:DNA polymerase V